MEEPRHHLTKAQRRELKRKQKEEKRLDRGRNFLLRRIFFLGLILFLAGFTGWFLYKEIFGPRPGIQVPIQGREHVSPGQPHEPYNSNPPTSGPHYPTTAEWGIHDETVAIELLVHNMEHGGVIIFYNCENCDDLVKNLKNLTEELRKKNRKVILVPNKEIGSKVAVASWGWYETYDGFEPEKIRAFFNAHINRGPEKVP